MTEVNIDILRDDQKFLFESVEPGQYFVHAGALFIKIEGIGEDGFEVNAIDLKNGMSWNFEEYDTVEICTRVDISAWMD